MSEIDELILASRALAHAASQAISLEQVPSRIVHEFYQAVRVQQEAAKARADSALDRASITAMFNVLADEIRKLDVALHEYGAFRTHIESIEGNMDGLRGYADERITALETVTLRIESQLTALRAEADKGREQLGEFVNKIASSFEGMLLGVQAQVLNAQQPARPRKKKQERKRRGRK